MISAPNETLDDLLDTLSSGFDDPELDLSADEESDDNIYRVAGRTRTLEGMEKTMLESLDNIPLEQIQRCVCFSFSCQD